jgi:hypothetical protein
VKLETLRRFGHGKRKPLRQVRRRRQAPGDHLTGEEYLTAVYQGPTVRPRPRRMAA